MKPRRQAQRIPAEAWSAVEKAVCAGMGYTEAARRFGIRSPHTIIMRARRNKWPVASRIEERTRALQARYKACEERRNCNEQATEAIAESWAEKGERHRGLAFEMAHNALKMAKYARPTVEGWQDIEKADKMARRAAGLDTEGSSNVNIGLTLVNQRISSPPDPVTLTIKAS